MLGARDIYTKMYRLNGCVLYCRKANLLPGLPLPLRRRTLSRFGFGDFDEAVV